MAGVKGKSGGLRNGAGRKAAPKPPPPPVVPNKEQEPLEFLQKVMRGEIECNSTQLRAAIAAAQYVHAKKGEGGKKEEAQKKADAVVSKFAPRVGPLKVVGK